MKKVSEELPNEETPKEENNGPGKRNKFFKAGKIFLIIGLLTIQAVAAYAVIKINYSDIKVTLDSIGSPGGYYYELENVIINPAESDGQRYLILSIAFEFNNKNDLGKAEKMKVELLDQVNEHLVQKTTSELSSTDNREQVKRELQEEVDALFGKKMVRNLFFTKYVIQ